MSTPDNCGGPFPRKLFEDTPASSVAKPRAEVRIGDQRPDRSNEFRDVRAAHEKARDAIRDCLWHTAAVARNHRFSTARCFKKHNAESFKVALVNPVRQQEHVCRREIGGQIGAGNFADEMHALRHTGFVGETLQSRPLFSIPDDQVSHLFAFRLKFRDGSNGEVVSLASLQPSDGNQIGRASCRERV